MAKRTSGTKPKATKRRPARSRQPKEAVDLSKRAMLGAGAGVLVTGIGLGALVGRLAKPAMPVAPAPQIAEIAPIPQGPALPPPVSALPAMEEEPLPADVYIAPKPSPAPLPPAVAQTGGAPSRKVAGSPIWQRNARPFVEASGRPVIAVVIDDLGLDHARTERAIGLDRALTLAFMTYAEKLPQWLAHARAGWHELLVHVPMQPESRAVDPGPNALTVALAPDEILRRLRWGLDRMDGYVGANNHMGSAFTENVAGMRVVLDELKARGLLFLDSRTTPHSACGPVAASVGVPFASRNVFLDNETTVAAVEQQILVLEGVARRHGTAIGIGHPHDATLTALAEWLPLAAARGFTVVPLTSAMRHAEARA